MIGSLPEAPQQKTHEVRGAKRVRTAHEDLTADERAKRVESMPRVARAVGASGAAVLRVLKVAFAPAPVPPRPQQFVWRFAAGPAAGHFVRPAGASTAKENGGPQAAVLRTIVPSYEATGYAVFAVPVTTSLFAACPRA